MSTATSIGYSEKEPWGGGVRTNNHIRLSSLRASVSFPSLRRFYPFIFGKQTCCDRSSVRGQCPPSNKMASLGALGHFHSESSPTLAHIAPTQGFRASHLTKRWLLDCALSFPHPNTCRARAFWSCASSRINNKEFAVGGKVSILMRFLTRYYMQSSDLTNMRVCCSHMSDSF